MNWYDIPGWCDNEITEIYDKAVELASDGSIFVELGAFKGRSSAYLIDKISQSRKNITLLIVDKWAWDFDFATHQEIQNADTYKEFMNFVGQERLALPNIKVFRYDSIDTAKFFNERDVDFIFFDTHHEYEHVIAELKAWLPKIKPDSLVAGHDFGHPGVKRAVIEVFGECETIESQKIHKIDVPGLKYEHFLTSWHTILK